MLRDSEAAKVHTVSCIAYGRFADATLRETNIDDDDDDYIWLWHSWPWM